VALGSELLDLAVQICRISVYAQHCGTGGSFFKHGESMHMAHDGSISVSGKCSTTMLQIDNHSSNVH
jgi:hypothetical protein